MDASDEFSRTVLQMAFYELESFVRTKLNPVVVGCLLKQAPLEAAKPTRETVAITEAVEAPPVQTAAAVQTPEPEKRLPKTAGLLPLVGLIGLLSLLAGFALWRFPKRPVS